MNVRSTERRKTMWKRIVRLAIWRNIADGAKETGAAQGAPEFGNAAYERNDPA
jgi:hypothetical protein